MLSSIRSSLRRPFQCATRSPSLIASLFKPLVLQVQQHRNASILGSLADNPGAYNKRIRRGRGPSSGKGKTSGRGHKGQKQHGKVPAGFNGGQTPDDVVHSKRGFKNRWAVDMSPINLDRIQAWVMAGRIDPQHPITVNELCSSRCLHGVKDGVKLLARGAVSLNTPIHLVVSRASDAAIQAVEKAGGSVTTRYYTKSSLSRVRGQETHPYHSLRSKPMPFEDQGLASTITIPERLQQEYEYRLPDPISRKDLEYYRDPAHRGYLSHTVDQGKSPSLFFKAPGDVKPKSTAKVAAKKAGSAGINAVW